ncbi:sigma-70 family RNA polymerase sigma factor [Loigolactobacillus jiayinensis]|uniref:Sigma-70 family RNA polymerase sigma factor n=1 Tax=Loigolactobacillus jiayinensis TaxID=2486016 RepID=A0ABW1RF28_9LACO|nr:sigma-70 family RNA polymerase sigma factor [Loigolactobacillus jiayinensis]
MTNQLSKVAFNDALQNKKLIFGVLKQCHITRQQADFDDYFQECLLAYVDAYCRYEQEQPPISRKNYLYTKLCQHTIDLWRKQTRYQQFCATKTDESGCNGFQQATMRLELKDLYCELTIGEQRVLELFYLNNFSQAEICQKFNVDRRTVYRWRVGLCAKAAKFL